MPREYMTLMDYIHIIIYLVIIISALISVFIYSLRKNENKIKDILITGQIVYPIFILSITIFIGLWLALTVKHNL